MFSCGICETFKNIYFVEYLQKAASGSCKHSIWTYFEIKDVGSIEFFRKMKVPSPYLKKSLLKGWKYPLRLVIQFFKNWQEYINSKRCCKKEFNLVWSLQPATLLLAYSFIRHELLCWCCSSFYVLFRNKHLWNITWWSLPLFVNCEMLFNFIFRTFQKNAFCETLFGGGSHYMLIAKF